VRMVLGVFSLTRRSRASDQFSMQNLSRASTWSGVKLLLPFICHHPVMPARTSCGAVSNSRLASTCERASVARPTARHEFLIHSFPLWGTVQCQAGQLSRHWFPDRASWQFESEDQNPYGKQPRHRPTRSHQEVVMARQEDPNSARHMRLVKARFVRQDSDLHLPLVTASTRALV
jgi:hypothetical protein